MHTIKVTYAAGSCGGFVDVETARRMCRHYACAMGEAQVTVDGVPVLRYAWVENKGLVYEELN